MIICCSCFKDRELIGIIKRLNKQGICSICGSSESKIYDTQTDTELVDSFETLLSIYTPQKLLPDGYPISELKMLVHELISTWDIFNNLSAKQVLEIITSICKEKYLESPELFSGPIGIAEYQDVGYLDTMSMLRNNTWESFVKDLKSKNRFHTRHINTEILEVFCSYRRKSYKAGQVFYRGRISSKAGLNLGEMGAPPVEKASAGRANSLGIRCLYLASDLETTIHEVRAGAHDYVSVGTFELSQDIVVVDLREIDRISPFLPELDCLQYAINKDVLKKLNTEMAKPLRRSDSPLEYVPTQYISEFIKSIEYEGKMEYAGIEYDSTVNPGGYNLAIFNPELFNCIGAEIYKIEELSYRKRKL